MKDSSDPAARRIEENRVFKKGGIDFLKPHDALEIIFLCEKFDYTVLGVDAFLVSETETQPFMEHSTDYSRLDKNSSIDLAKHHLEKFFNSEFVFEVVYDK